MVQNESCAAESPAGEAMPVLDFNKLAKGIDDGHYKIVGWAADTTGRRLIDEMCQIAAYTSDSQFSQYIMPFGDIRLLYRRRHNIRIMSVGKYRMLKDMRTNKFVKTKSEVTTLTEFVQWLEENRGDASDGIILVFHEMHKTIPAMLLESMRRHNLSERFARIVKGFANSFALAQAKCANTTKSFTLRVMSKVLLNKEHNLSSAVARAQASYNIVLHLGQSERNELDANGSGDAKINDEMLINMIRHFTNPVSAEEEEIRDFKVVLDRQNTFKPVFGDLLRGSPVERQHASHLRRLLAENQIDYDKCKTAYEMKAKEGLEEVLKTQLPCATDEERSELLEILDCYFDPEKKPVQPKPKFFVNNNKPRRYRTKSGSRKDRSDNHQLDETKVVPLDEGVVQVKKEPEDEECAAPEAVHEYNKTVEQQQV